MPERTFDSSDAAAEAGRKSGKRRRELARLRAEDPSAFMREKFAAARTQLADELLDAALGNGQWHELPLEKRLSALSKALEYAVGRPTPRRDQDEAPSPAETPGLTIE